MKRNYFLIVALFLALIVALTGCKDVADGLTSVNGSAVNARSATLAGIEGVTVTFTEVGGTGSLTDTTSTSGSYSVSYNSSGLYEVTASKSGWFFIPQQVYIGGWLQDVPDLLGIQLESASDVSLILVWNGEYMDVDGHLTFPDGNILSNGDQGNHTPVQVNVFDSPYEAYPAGGFGPDANNREHISPSFVELSNNSVDDVLLNGNLSPAISLDRDDWDGFGPEVITIRSVPFWPNPFNPTLDFSGDGENVGNHLPAPDSAGTWTWTWIGTMDYYVDGWNKTASNAPQGATGDISSTSGSGADAVLYITQGSSLKGVYTVPASGDFRTVRVARINMFIGIDNLGNTTVWRLQFVPDVEITNYLGIKSLGTQTTGIISVGGKGRATVQ